MTYLTTEQAAALLNVSQHRIRILAKEGRLGEAVPPNREWMIPEDAVREFRRKGPNGKLIEEEGEHPNAQGKRNTL